MSQFTLILFNVIALLCTFLYKATARKKDTTTTPLPPSPKPLPIIGNLLDLPPRGGPPEYHHWLKHKALYGPISSVTVMGTTLIVLNNKEAAREVLEKQSAKTSSRPQSRFGHGLCGYDKIMAFQVYNETYRRRRKIAHQQLGRQVVAPRYSGVLGLEARRLLLRVLERPEMLIEHIKTQGGAILLETTYGYSVEPEARDPLVDLIELMLEQLSAAFVPMAWLIDMFPIMSYLPESLPGMKFLETAREWRRTNDAVANVPYAFVQRQMSRNRHRPSFVSRLLGQTTRSSIGDIPRPSPQDEDDIKWTAATLYSAGSETTSSTVICFVLAMVLFPEVQRKAQAEIDSVIGPDAARLPDFDDEAKLPYLRNLIKETYRWFTVVPMGVPHMCDEEFTYKGYTIPKGSYLIPSIWGFCHDPEVYADPAVFDPDRYLAPRNEPDPRGAVFGFGRRICPGRHFAEAAVFITVAQMLAVFDTSRAVDERGNELEVKIEARGSLSNLPGEFPYAISPRSVRHAELVRRVETEQPHPGGDSSLLEWV